MKPYILFLFFIISKQSFSQNWKSVIDNDTTYFRAHCVGCKDSNFNGYLRCYWIDSTQVIGNNDVYFFNKCYTDSSFPSNCQNFIFNSFVGDKVIRDESTGYEYFSNKLQQQILIKTFANLNESWSMIQDTAGIDYIAKVTNVYTMVIDGVTDSVKDIEIQAYLNGNPYNSPVNDLKLILSKNFGMQEIIEFNSFPIYFSNYIQSFSIQQPNLILSHSRIDSYIKSIDFNYKDLSMQYTPGNEWIIENKSGFGDCIALINEYMINFDIDHDSIISVNFINANTIEYTFQRKRHHIFHAKSVALLELWGTDTTMILTDTIYQSTSTRFLNSKMCSDIIDTTFDKYILMNVKEFIPVYYFLDTICGHYLLRNSHNNRFYNIYDTILNCFNLFASISGHSIFEKSSLHGFDFKFKEYWYWNDINIFQQHDYTKLYYLKADSCTYGNKVNVFGLPSNDINILDNNFTLYPNPAKDFLNLYNNQMHNKIKSVSIYDLMGNKIYEMKQNNENKNIQLDISRYNNGIYFIKIDTDNNIITKKFIILH